MTDSEMSDGEFRQWKQSLEERARRIEADPVQREEATRESERIRVADQVMELGQMAEARGDYVMAAYFYEAAAAEDWGDAAVRAAACHLELGDPATAWACCARIQTAALTWPGWRAEADQLAARCRDQLGG